MRRPKAFWFLNVVLIFAAFSSACLADTTEDRRVRTGAKLFRALLAADLGLDERVNENGRLRVLVITDDPKTAAIVAGLIAGDGGEGAGTLRGIPLEIDYAGELTGAEAPLGGVFIASPTALDSISEVAKWGIARNTIVYSPYEGHVEQGVLAGLSVEARVRPYLNRRTMEASGIHLKPFFIRVSRILE